jgi:hypothetical protein
MRLHNLKKSQCFIVLHFRVDHAVLLGVGDNKVIVGFGPLRVPSVLTHDNTSVGVAGPACCECSRSIESKEVVKGANKQLTQTALPYDAITTALGVAARPV